MIEPSELSEIRKNYQSLFVALNDNLKSYIYRIVGHRQETEDIAQDTYIKVSKGINSFKGNSSFKVWVFSIATNLCRDSLRTRQALGRRLDGFG